MPTGDMLYTMSTAIYPPLSITIKDAAVKGIAEAKAYWATRYNLPYVTDTAQDLRNNWWQTVDAFADADGLLDEDDEVANACLTAPENFLVIAAWTPLVLPFLTAINNAVPRRRLAVQFLKEWNAQITEAAVLRMCGVVRALATAAELKPEDFYRRTIRTEQMLADLLSPQGMQAAEFCLAVMRGYPTDDLPKGVYPNSNA